MFITTDSIKEGLRLAQSFSVIDSRFLQRNVVATTASATQSCYRLQTVPGAMDSAVWPHALRACCNCEMAGRPVDTKIRKTNTWTDDALHANALLWLRWSLRSSSAFMDPYFVRLLLLRVCCHIRRSSKTSVGWLTNSPQTHAGHVLCGIALNIVASLGLDDWGRSAAKQIGTAE